MGIIQTIVTKMTNAVINRNGLPDEFDNKEVGADAAILLLQKNSPQITRIDTD